MEPLLIDVEEGARLLGIGRSRFYLLLQTGEVESLKIGRRRVVPLTALEAFVERLRREQAPPPELDEEWPNPTLSRANGR